MEPKPFQKPHPPIWFGGRHPDALRRAVRLGDGFFGAGSSTTAEFVEHVRVVRDALAEAGREPGSFRIAKRVYIGVDDDGDRARRRVTTAMRDLYGYFGMPNVEAFGVGGRPDECAAALREVRDAGAQMVLLNPLYDEAEQLERLAAEVVPQLR
jgi:alkanesulfonate monooxygenase SsuD/methylene tetrahydromethanopterin reductase-like flavin-dependent oxidoreductase (luciferase family)